MNDAKCPQCESRVIRLLRHTDSGIQLQCLRCFAEWREFTVNIGSDKMRVVVDPTMPEGMWRLQP